MPASILLIDDDADDREVFNEALQEVGPHIRFESVLKSNEAFKHIPIIIYSTSAPDGIQETAMRLGALSYVLKPSQFNELKKMLARVVALIDKEAILTFSI